MFCEFQTSTTVVFPIRKMASVDSASTASLLFQLEKDVLWNLHEHNRCFSNWTSCFCEFGINRIIAFLLGTKHVLWNPDEHNRWFSNSKNEFCEFRINAITVFLIGIAWSAKSRRTQSLLFSPEKWLLWIPYSQHHCFSNWKDMFCEFQTSTIVASLKVKSCFCELRINRIIVFPIETHVLRNPDEHSRCFSDYKFGSCWFRDSVLTESLLFWLENHVLRNPDEHNRCCSN